MAQGIIGGATSYEEQSLSDILLDIKKWLEYTDKIKHSMELWLKSSKENGFWQRVEFDFQMTVYSSISYFNTIGEDLKMVKVAIETNNITEREVSLLRKIGRKANEYNNEYPRTYKSEKRCWHDYGNPDFEIVEKMYAKGRDYFVTLQDAGNAASRLEDYMSRGQTINNTMNISGNVTGSQIQQGTVNSCQQMSNEGKVPYEKISTMLSQIKQYSENELFNSEFGDKADAIREMVDEALEATEQKSEPSKIKNTLTKLKGYVTNVGSGIIASGIFKLIESALENW